MKQFLKILIIVVCVVFIILLVAPFVFKKQIATQVQKAANRQLNATVRFDPDISLSFIRNFPDASLGIADLSITGKDEYAGDTLLFIPHAHLVIDLFSLFGGKTYRIRNVQLDRPYVQLLVDSAGKANWNITTPDTSSLNASPSAFKAALQKYSIQQGHLIFSDSANGFYLQASGLEHQGKGDFTSQVFDLVTRSHADSLTVSYGGIPYLDHVATDIDAVLHVDMPHSTYAFTRSTIQLNGLTLGVDGSVSLPDSNSVKMDVHFKAAQAGFRNFLSLIPAIYQKDFKSLKASGTVSFSGYVKGIYNGERIPAFSLALQVGKGMFRYPSLPEPLSEVNLDLLVNNDDGIADHTVIDLKRLHFRMGSSPFDARFTLRNPKSDPWIDGTVRGTLDLADLAKIYPLEKGTEVGGRLQLDVQAKGRVGSVTGNKQPEITAAGEVTARNLVYRSASLAQDVDIPQGKLAFSAGAVKVDNINARIGRSDLQADGQLDHVFGYLFGKSPLKGTLRLRSHLLDLNGIMGAKTGAGDTTSAVKAITVPRNIDFSVQAAIDSFVYATYVLTGVHGQAAVSDGILHLDDIRAGMLDGDVRLNGTYNTRNPRAPETNIALAVDSIAIQKAFRTFSSIRVFAPAAAFARGSLSGNISFSSLLNDNLTPEWRSVNSQGNIRIPDLAVAGFAPLKKMASALGLPELQNLHIPQVSLSYRIDSGFLQVKPFDFTVDSITMHVSGKNGLDKQIDYDILMHIPRSRLGNASTALNSLFTKAGRLTGTSVRMPDQVDAGVLLTGTITDPVVRLDLSKEKEQLEKVLRSGATQKLNQEKTKLLDQVFKKDSGKAQQKNAPAGAVQKAVQKGLHKLLHPAKDTGR